MVETGFIDYAGPVIMSEKPIYVADDVTEIAKKMREIACNEGRHEWKDNNYCRWCSKHNDTNS